MWLHDRNESEISNINNAMIEFSYAINSKDVNRNNSIHDDNRFIFLAQSAIICFVWHGYRMIRTHTHTVIQLQFSPFLSSCL